MSPTGAVTTQDPTCFYWTQQIWQNAWHHDDGCSLPSITAKVACVVFPILLSVAIVEGVLWAWSVFKIPSDPKSAALDPQSVKKAFSEIIPVKSEPSTVEQILSDVVPTQSEPVVEETLLKVVPVKSEPPVAEQILSDVVPTQSEPVVEETLPEVVATLKKSNETFVLIPLDEQALSQPIDETLMQEFLKHINSIDVENFMKSFCLVLDLNEGSSQHDIVDNEFDPENLRPPACAYHAMQAAKDIASSFCFYEQNFKFNRVRIASEFQRRIIIHGTQDYFDSVKRDPSLKEAADLESIKIKDPDSLARLHLHLQQTNLDPKTEREWANAIVEHLFVPQEKPTMMKEQQVAQIALLKNRKNEHLAVICAGEKAIFFNSHYNQIVMTPEKMNTKAHLIRLMQQGDEQHSFSYTLGQYNVIT